MESVPHAPQSEKYSLTSTPVLDAIRPATVPKWEGKSAGEYFFLSSAVILVLIFLPWFRQTAATLSFDWVILNLAIVMVVIPGLALAVAFVVHEAGHLCVARMSGFRPAGSLESRALDFYACPSIRFATIELEPGTLEGSSLSRSLLMTVMGGPLASLIAPAILEGVILLVRPRPMAAFAAHIFSTASCLLAVAELIPDSGKGKFSDGARILMLLRQDAAAKRWLSNLEFQLALARGEQPRNWHEGAITTATLIEDDTRDALTARWLGYLWAIEREDITMATKFLEEALSTRCLAGHRLRDRLFVAAAFFQGWFRENPTKTQLWAKRVARRRISPVLSHRLDIVLLWSDGKLFDAWERLGAYFHAIQEQPPSPVRALLEQSATEWKREMESRMLTRAWRAMYAMSQEVDLTALQNANH